MIDPISAFAAANAAVKESNKQLSLGKMFLR